jgi:hypothetical protein
MRTFSATVVAAAMIGAAAVGGAAFTGSGLASGAPATTFIGGTAGQTVSGATLTGVEYGFVDDGMNTGVETITLRLTGAEGGHVTGWIDGDARAVSFTDPSPGLDDGVFIADLGAEPYADLDTLTITVS